MTFPHGTLFEPATIETAVERLSRRDRRLARLLARHRPAPRPRPTNLFAGVGRTICSQMLSNQAARHILGRVEALCGGELHPGAVLALDEAELRGAGLSTAKVACLREVAARFRSPDFALHRPDGLDVEAVRRALLGIRGLGPWSVEMFLLFSLGHPDVFSTRDAALTGGLVRLKGLPRRTPAARLERIAARWRPYRSVASLALWTWRHHDWAPL